MSYVLFCVIPFLLALAASKLVAREVDVATVIAALVLSVIPLLNIVVGIFALAVIVVECIERIGRKETPHWMSKKVF